MGHIVSLAREEEERKKPTDLVVLIRSRNTLNDLRLPHMYFLEHGQAMITEYLLLQVTCKYRTGGLDHHPLYLIARQQSGTNFRSPALSLVSAHRTALTMSSHHTSFLTSLTPLNMSSSRQEVGGVGEETPQ